ncbi:MAG: 5-formyltetrahydrofolate cyclo-ligase [Gudongella sp.]|nr:5-formyltetrahydrofolate cyclo-ligase [Gudongella sp.]
MDKITLRKKILSERAQIPLLTRQNYSERINKLIKSTSYYKNSKTIMCFLSFSHEVDTHNFIKEAITEGKRIIVPVSIHEPRELIPSELRDFDELEIGYYNILTPKKQFIRPIAKEEIELIIVPGVVFDSHGFRVGYGGGYYDRFLLDVSKTVPKISIGFGMQIIEQVPRESFDIPVDMIITEKGSMPCSEGLYDSRD